MGPRAAPESILARARRRDARSDARITLWASRGLAVGSLTRPFRRVYRRSLKRAPAVWRLPTRWGAITLSLRGHCR